ncbi:MAG: prepilin-type N-terminal cleavage/methylation domain-containing protein [Pseudomonadota bacterium]
MNFDLSCALKTAKRTSSSISQNSVFSRGFTIIEVMMCLSILGVLASLALPFYEDYITKSRLVEVSNFMGEVRTEIMSYRSTSGEFPDQIKGSQSRVAARQAGLPRVRRSASRVRPAQGLITEYYYEYNPRRDWAYVAVRLDPDAIPECEGRCMLHMGIAAVGDSFETSCGRWNQAFWPDPFPPSVLPRECDSESVSRDLRRATRRR